MNRRIWFLAIIIFVFVPTITLYSAPAAQAEKKVADDAAVEKLLEDMKIFKVSPSVVPVEFTLKDITGQNIRMSDFRGKIVFLNFWTTWCPYCRIEMPSMEKLHRKMAGKPFAIVAVDLQESASKVEAFFKKYKLTFTSLLDSEGVVGERFGVISIPTSFILDKSGRIIAKAIGPREWDGKESVALFEYLMKD